MSTEIKCWSPASSGPPGSTGRRTAQFPRRRWSTSKIKDSPFALCTRRSAAGKSRTGTTASKGTDPAPEKNAIQEHILRLELAAVRELKRRAEAVEERCSFFYDDFSLSDGSRFRLSSMENSADDLIAYITGRLEAIGCPPEDEDGTTKEEEDGA